jgi:hypothetical protein
MSIRVSAGENDKRQVDVYIEAGICTCPINLAHIENH